MARRNRVERGVSAVPPEDMRREGKLAARGRSIETRSFTYRMLDAGARDRQGRKQLSRQTRTSKSAKKLTELGVPKDKWWKA